VLHYQPKVNFESGMVTGPPGLALVSTIINLAHSLKLNVVAEGVEAEEQSRLLRLLNCELRCRDSCSANRCRSTSSKHGSWAQRFSVRNLRGRILVRKPPDRSGKHLLRLELTPPEFSLLVTQSGSSAIEGQSIALARSGW
jgi:hypothetical protein